LVEVLQKEPTCCPDNKVFVANQDARDLRPLAPAAWTPEDIFLLAGRFSKGSGIHKKTQGTHSAYLYHDGRIVFAAEDIGRHNALDKVIGYMLLHALKPETCMVYTTGRVPTDMVEKAVAAGVPVLVTKAVPTDQAVQMAKRYNLTLICKAWPDSFEIFHDGGAS
ncbi:MAG: formate dehydrogenase accessory sulfurtransferase FdhD, partial [Lachnospiraceae bacterium]|nr:formate dehydrogenase accessory sulfurtransferase FdhD [Lachnospiraceae bacterium]